MAWTAPSPRAVLVLTTGALSTTNLPSRVMPLLTKMRNAKTKLRELEVKRLFSDVQLHPRSNAVATPPRSQTPTKETRCCASYEQRHRRGP
jgi:hypothetical protein